MNHSQPLDPVAVAVVLATLFFSPDVSAVVGPYAVIVLAATTGAAWALSRHEPMSRLGSAVFFARLLGTAVLISVGLAEMTFSALRVSEPKLLLPAIALLVGGIGDDWPLVGRWFVGLAQRAIDVFVSRKGGGQ